MAFKRDRCGWDFLQILAANDDYNFGKTILLYDLHKNNTLDIITTTFNQIIIHHSDGARAFRMP